MIRNLFLFVVALVLLSICSNLVRAAEITINWRQKLDSGRVSDLKFMPGQNTFIHSTGYETQIRSCENGELIAKYPIKATKYEFTPDSTKLILLNGFHYIQKRNLDDVGLLMEYELPTDSVYYIGYVDIKVDPIRPYIYALWRKSKHEGSQWITYDKILIFNSETLEPVGELMPQTDLLLSNLAVSKDGKFLAIMNAGYTSKLMVWSLDTRQQIIDKQIGNSGKGWSDPADVKFSDLNTDKIYFTGAFYRELNVGNLGGLCIYSIGEDKIIDSNFAVAENKIGSGLFTFFENESKIMATTGEMFYILDLIENKKVYEKFNLVEDGINANHSIYNENYKYFIGAGGIYIDKFQYQPNTSVPLDNKKEVIYPNPTTGIVNIPINCQSSVTYKIFDTNGILLKSNIVNISTTQNLLTIDCSDLLRGVYTIQIICDKNINQYHLVKGE